MLRDERGRVVRLAWEARGDAERETNDARTLPASKYTLIGYRVFDRSRPGEIWQISGSGPKLRTIEIPAAGEVTLALPRTLKIKQRFDGASAGMEIRGAHAAGVTIYKNGARIPMRYRVLDAADVELTKGSMHYG